MKILNVRTGRCAETKMREKFIATARAKEKTLGERCPSVLGHLPEREESYRICLKIRVLRQGTASAVPQPAQIECSFSH
jgi:hypothetical protein